MYIVRRYLTKLTSNTTKRIKKIALTIAALTTLTLGFGALVSAETNFTTVYYVYINDEYVGTVSDKKIIEDAIDEKLDQAEDKYESHFNFAVGSNLTYVPEHVFHTVANTDDAQVAERLKKDLAVEANATAIKIDDKPAVYVKDKESAKQVMEAIKLKYVTKEELDFLEKRKEDPSIALPPLKKNEFRVTDVQLSKKVSFSEEKITPNQILTVDEAVNYLLKGTLSEKKYKVKDGDVLGKIADKHDMTLKQLLSINPGLKEDSLLKIDQEINVAFYKPIVEVIVEREVLKKEKVAYEKEVVENSSMYKGDKKVKQKGKDGKREVTYKISEKNGKEIKKETVNEKIIEKPVNEIIIKGTKVIPSRGDGSFTWPAVGGYISSTQGYRWGKLHKGIDIARPASRTIKAADNGKVVFAGKDGGYGNKVIIDHQNGFRTVYAHLASISVHVGQTVAEGTKIGIMGSTGNSTGVHLHFEVYKNGSLKNPLKYIR